MYLRDRVVKSTEGTLIQGFLLSVILRLTEELGVSAQGTPQDHLLISNLVCVVVKSLTSTIFHDLQIFSDHPILKP